MIRLDARLNAVLSEIEPCMVLADIGSDHGKLAVLARLKGLSDRVIAGDVSELSLKKARRLADKHGAEIDIRVGDGIAVLKDGEYDTVVIAGMGGLEIASILNKSPNKFKRYILAPHSKAAELRRYLSASGIAPERDYKVFSNGRFYDIISAAPGEYNPSIDVIYYGNHQNTPIFRQFCAKERARLNKIIESGGDEEYTVMLDILNDLDK